MLFWYRLYIAAQMTDQITVLRKFMEEAATQIRTMVAGESQRFIPFKIILIFYFIIQAMYGLFRSSQLTPMPLVPGFKYTYSPRRMTPRTISLRGMLGCGVISFQSRTQRSKKRLPRFPCLVEQIGGSRI